MGREIDGQRVGTAERVSGCGGFDVNARCEKVAKGGREEGSLSNL
jgi:hypothetical protein